MNRFQKICYNFARFGFNFNLLRPYNLEHKIHGELRILRDVGWCERNKWQMNQVGPDNNSLPRNNSCQVIDLYLRPPFLELMGESWCEWNYSSGPRTRNTASGSSAQSSAGTRS